MHSARVALAALFLCLLFALRLPARAIRAESPAGAEVKLWTDSAPPPVAVWSCIEANPSCAWHEPWWREAFTAPASPGLFVRFSSLGAGFTADSRLAEAVLWVSMWDQGRALLRDAALQSVSVRLAAIATRFPDRAEAAADYDARTRTISVNPRFLLAPSWLLGDLLAHELTHAAQARAGGIFGAGLRQCVATELPARQAEVDYVRFVALHMNGLITEQQVATLAPEGAALFSMVVGLLEAPDLRALVAGLCQTIAA